MGLFSQLSFFTTVNEWRQLPDSQWEVAFAGRSNAGKSSAINTLANRTRLAFVSKTPGRTQHINFFTMQEQQYLVDLPGYGYADVPEKIQAHWQKLLARYLQTRPMLVGLVLIMDIRHPLKPLDWQMLEWFSPTGKPIHILLSKADKLPRSHAATQLQSVKQALKNYPQCSVQLFSSLKKQGVQETEACIKQWLERYPPVPVVAAEVEDPDFDSDFDPDFDAQDFDDDAEPA